ncbi:MAG: hypothetical protein IPP70_09025 [Elusimicrobia bacterium]|nr:hypothetical protein [Elusimicrobiota bacterium]
MKFKISFGVFTFALAAFCAAGEPRHFLMGTTPIHISSVSFPFWTFADTQDQDLISIHGDDFLGVPWDQFANNKPLPAPWAQQWATIAKNARDTGKVRYLALSPLGGRKTLTKNVTAAGTYDETWAPVDADGCYPFSTDVNADTHRRAYVAYASYLIDLVQPRYFSPVIEMDIQFFNCPAQKDAFIAWYGEVHRSLKARHPSLTIFPTFQFEYLYGVALGPTDPSTPWCGGPRTDASLRACFERHLATALTVPGDRIAFSMYPLQFLFPPIPPDSYATGFSRLNEAFTIVQQKTARKIWVAETGWSAVKVLTSYQHPSPPSGCGAVLIDDTVVGGEANLRNYLEVLLSQAQDKKFEAVVWWEMRDLLKGADADACPCPRPSDTCAVLDTFYAVGGQWGELLLRRFGNMGLRRFDGSPRSAHELWVQTFRRPLATTAGFTHFKGFPNPLREGGTATFTDLPGDATLKIFTVSGEWVQTVYADFTGQALWDGRDRDGRPAPTGVYLVRAESRGGRKTLKFAVVR